MSQSKLWLDGQRKGLGQPEDHSTCNLSATNGSCMDVYKLERARIKQKLHTIWKHHALRCRRGTGSAARATGTAQEAPVTHQHATPRSDSDKANTTSCRLR